MKQLLQPALLPLSHYSPASKMALPHVVQAGAVGKVGLVQNLSQYVYKVREKGTIGVVLSATVDEVMGRPVVVGTVTR